MLGLARDIPIFEFSRRTPADVSRCFKHPSCRANRHAADHTLPARTITSDVALPTFKHTPLFAFCTDLTSGLNREYISTSHSNPAKQSIPLSSANILQIPSVIMPSQTDSASNSSREPSPTGDQAPGPSVASPSSVSVHEVDTRKQPWRSLPGFESLPDNVSVKSIKDMRLFGENVNAHS
jgi:hypothetical protein